LEVARAYCLNMIPLVLLHLAVTLVLVGLIWTIQVVHYPLMSMVGAEAFAAYHSAHSTQITFLVGPLMVAELLSALFLVLSPPTGVSAWACWLGLFLVGVVWVSTALLQVPAHNQLSLGFNAEVHAWLVRSNWVRTLAWTARGGLWLYLVAPLFSKR
jgi:hypothetical protein